MEISTNSNKRAFICAASYIPANEASFVNYPGADCAISGSFTPIKFSDASFTETDSVNGEPVEQNLQFVFKGQSSDFDTQKKILTGTYNIIMLEYSNDDILIIGTKENPVLFSSVKSGRVVENVLESKRFSAEPAKRFEKI